MATKTFSGRADGELLAFADALAREQHGLSFGQYCSTVLLDTIGKSGSLPQLNPSTTETSRVAAAAFIKGFSSQKRNPSIGTMSDQQTRDLIASRYA